MRFEQLEIGQTAEFTKTISNDDVMRFAEITGDFNPVHVDEAAAANSPFGGRVVHGMLTAGLISAALAGKLPGSGSIYLSQTLKFMAPVRIGETVTVHVRVIELLVPKRRVRLSTVCRTETGETVLEGEALVLVPDGVGAQAVEASGASAA
jgi:3-hydroxybutyryl-CoA dehydratase